MLYSTLGRLVLIGQILSFKCNNVKETDRISLPLQNKANYSSFVH